MTTAGNTNGLVGSSMTNLGSSQTGQVWPKKQQTSTRLEILGCFFPCFRASRDRIPPAASDQNHDVVKTTSWERLRPDPKHRHLHWASAQDGAKEEGQVEPIGKDPGLTGSCLGPRLRYVALGSCVFGCLGVVFLLFAKLFPTNFTDWFSLVHNHLPTSYSVNSHLFQAKGKHH